MNLKEIHYGIEIETVKRTREQIAWAIHSVVGGTVRHVGIPSSYDPWEVEDLRGRIWKVVGDASLTSVFLTGREAFRIMKKQNRGRIVSIGSISAKMPRPGAVAYVGAKFGLDGMNRAMGLEGRDYGITCTVIHPGFTATGFGPDAGMKPGRDSLDPKDVANMVVFAASLPDEANWLDGTIIPIGQPFLGRG